MKNYNNIRYGYRLKSAISNFLNTHKISIIILTAVLILGLISGIFTASRYSGDLKLENIPDDNIISFLCREKGSFSLFFSYFIKFTIAGLLIIFFNINSFSNFIFKWLQ